MLRNIVISEESANFAVEMTFPHFSSNNSFRLAMIVIITIVVPVIVICFLLQVDWIEEEGRIFAHRTFVHKWDWISLLFALSSYVIAVLTFLSQRQTERNTTKTMTKEIQLRLLKGSLRRLYVNYIVSEAILIKCSGAGFRCYPSEEHKYKMLVPEDIVHPELFYGSPEDFDHVHGILQMIRIYNHEIQTVWNHLMSAGIPAAEKEKDIENILLQKPGTMAWNIGRCIRNVWKDATDDIAGIIMDVHSRRENDGQAAGIPEEDIVKSNFIKFFSGEDDRDKFISKVRRDVFTLIDNPNSIVLFPLSE